MERLNIELLDQKFKLDLLTLLQREKQGRSCCVLVDCRVWIEEGQYGVAENAKIKDLGHDYTGSYLVRVLAGDPRATGFDGRNFGPSDFPRLMPIISDSVETAYRLAMTSSHQKGLRKEGKWGPLGDSLWSTELALHFYPIPFIDSVPASFRIDPRSVPLATIATLLKDVSKQVKDRVPRIVFQQMVVVTGMVREVIAGTRGACIDQTFAITEAIPFFVGQEGEVQQIHYDALAHQCGWEIMEEGVNDGFTCLPNFPEFTLALAHEVSNLCAAPPCPTVPDAVVVTDSHYNTLKVHEIVGHPTEADRLFKMETAYAGRTWMDKIGMRVASPLVTAYSDPLLPGYGHYKYDHEGTQAHRVVHIENGILLGFMTSAQTAALLGSASNGHWRSSRGDLVPLIRMSNTVFAPGDCDPREIIREVDHGFYLCGHAIPSIAESRENFRILARRVYEIRDGKIGQMFRDGGIMADSREYLLNVDAVGSDFRLYPIFNCGKGSPMQIKKLGNGGPTMRSRAKLVGPTGGK